MSIPEFERFSEPRPPAFPFRVDVRPDKKWDLTPSFGKQLADKLEEQEGSSSGTQSQADHEAKQAEIKATKEMALLASGLKFLSNTHKINIEYTGSRFNHERVKETDYVGKNQLLKMLPENINLSQQQAMAGEGNSFFHNINIYQALGLKNPFKKQDKKNYDIFEEDPHFDIMGDRFLSPLESLKQVDQHIWTKMNDTLNSVTERYSDYSLKNVSDPYYGNDIDSFNMYMDYFDIVSRPEIYDTLSDDEVFYVLLSAFEDLTRFNKMFTGIYGDSIPSQNPKTLSDVINLPSVTSKGKNSNTKISDTLNDTDAVTGEGGTPETAQTSDVPILTEDDAQFIEDTLDNDENVVELIEEYDLTPADLVLAKAAAWWETTGSKLENATQLMSAGLIPTLAETFTQMTDWGTIGENSDGDTKKIFDRARQQLVSGYFRYIEDNVLPELIGQPFVKPQNLVLDNTQRAEGIWSILVSKGYINSDGTIAGQFKPNDPGFKFDLDLEASEENRIFDELRRVWLGELDPENQDHTLVNGYKRKNIQFVDQEGNARAMKDILALIDKGDTADEKLENTKSAYHFLLDLYQKMTGLESGEGGQGKVIINHVEDGVELVIDAPVQWEEWNPNHTVTDKNGKQSVVGGWETRTEESITLRFETEQEAQRFADRILMLTQTVTPVLGLFSKEDLFVLNGNVASTQHADMITENHAEYKMSINTFYDYNSEVLKPAHDYVVRETSVAIGKKIFEKNQINKMVYNRHREKMDEYWEKKEEHEREEIERIKKVMRTQAEDKKREKIEEAQRKALMEQLRKEDEKKSGAKKTKRAE